VNPVVGITLPFKFAPGADSVVLDSLLTSNGRAAAFVMPKPLYTKEQQTLLVNMLQMRDSTGPKEPPIPSGEGLLATLFFSAKGAFPMAAFRMVETQLPPQNVLMYVTQSLNSVQPAFELVRKPAPAGQPESSSTPSPSGGQKGKAKPGKS